MTSLSISKRSVRNKFILFILYMPIYLIALPYFGSQFGKLGPYLVFFTINIVSLMVVLFLWAEMPIRKYWFLFLIPLLPWGIGTLNGIRVNGSISSGDLFEIIRPFGIFINFLLGYFLYKKYSFKENTQSLLKVLTFLIILNFIVSVFPVLGFNEIAKFSAWFGLGVEYHAGYAGFRAFGIVGQPGVLAIFCNFCALLLYFYYIDYKSKKKNTSLIILLYLLLFFSILASGSRIGLGFWFINFIVASVFIKKLRILLFVLVTTIILVTYVYWVELSDFVSLMSRGINLAEGTTGSLGFRLMYKVLIFDLLSNDLISFFFGIGPSKEVLQAPLRHPDSSISVYNIRYGYLGLLIYSTPILLIFYFSCTAFFKKTNSLNNSKRLFLTVSMVVQIYFLVVGHLEPAYEDFKINVLFFYLCGFTVSLIESRNEQVNTDASQLKEPAHNYRKTKDQK